MNVATIHPSPKASTVTKNIPVNARNGSVAEAVLSSFLKRDLRPGGIAYGAGFTQFDIEGWTRPGPDLPNYEVAVNETVRDERRLHTYMVQVTLHRAAEYLDGEDWDA